MLTLPTQQPTQQELAALKAAAEAATPGPWTSFNDLVESKDETVVAHVISSHYGPELGDPACDAAFIAAWNPAISLALLDLIDAQQKKIAELTGWISVEDRLPPNYEEVMIWPHPTDYIMTAEIYGMSASGCPVWKYGEYTTGWGHETVEMTRPVTHWMPLPPPPEPA